MTNKIGSKQTARHGRSGAAGRQRRCRLNAVQPHMHGLALTRQGAVAVAVASALALAGTGTGAQAAAADENAAVEAGCKIAVEKVAKTIGPGVSLSRQAAGRSHASRGRGHAGKAHRQAKRVSHQAVVTVPGWNTVITDSIGPYTEMLLTNSEGAGNCLVGPNPSEAPAGISGSFGGETVDVAPNQIGGIDLGFERAHDFKPFGRIDGRVGSNVSAVRFTLQDGTHVSAKLAHGWFLAFWEGLRHAATVEVVSAGGTSNNKFYDPTAHEF